MPGSVVPRTFEQKLKLRTSGFRRLVGLLVYELDVGVRLPLRKRLRAWRHGFISVTYVLYDLDHNDPGLFLPDMAHVNYDLLERYRLAVNDKLGFPHLMQAVGARSPELLGYLEGGHLQLFNGRLEGSPLRALTQLIAQAGRVVLRPLGGQGGRGIFFVGGEEGAIEVDGEVRAAEELNSWLCGLDRYIVTEFIDQAAYAEALFRATPNTLRLLTMWDKDRHEPFLAAAAHRIGDSGTRLVDNFHCGHGGLSAPIDMSTGVLGPAATLDRKGRLVSYSRHPETHSEIDGVQVPGWPDVVQQVLRVAAALPQFPFVGWDLLMADSGLYWIEGNSPMGTDVWQVHEPLLKDPRTRDAFAALGMA